jgi:site-specific recombinase XerD
MIEVFFKDPTAVRRHRDGPLGPYIDSFSERLREKGYARFTARHQIQLIAKLGKWLHRRRVIVRELNSERIEEFITLRRRCGRLREGNVATLRQFLQHLIDIGAVPSRVRKTKKRPIDHIEHGFKEYLEQQRALESTTVERYLPFARQFLSERFGKKSVKLSQLTGRDITAYVSRHAYDYSPGTAKLMVTALRGFLRFLTMQGEVSTDLSACVPTVADWRSTTLPKSIQPEEVKKLLRSCDRWTSHGLRL